MLLFLDLLVFCLIELMMFDESYGNPCFFENYVILLLKNVIICSNFMHNFDILLQK